MKFKLYQPRNPNMPTVNWCVFNCLEQEQEQAKALFVAKYGEHKWPIVARRMKTGVMELFHHKPNCYTAFYVNTLAEIVDRRIF